MIKATTSALDVIQLPTSDQIAWVEAVNERWLVRPELRANARNYLASLTTDDTPRLERTARTVVRIMECAPDYEDPKPRFYAALFSLATFAERARFLDTHWFTQLSLPDCEENLSQMNLAPDTLKKLIAIRSEIRALLRE